ncbi:hypothetical protein [Elongatibacter sediminis]|uniref:MAM domain-containing protein n=1 Tax=Elongatibacter sediminis TaxID=3119006 RepID=A0AAW9RJ39_9GAMM
MMHRFSDGWKYGIIFWLSLGFSATASAQINFLDNAAFNNDLSGWDVLSNETSEWIDTDSGDNPASGAVELMHIGTSNGGTALSLSQCIVATPMVDYEFGGYFRVPDGQPEGTEAVITVRTFQTSNCVGDTEQFFDLGSRSDRWQRRSEFFSTGEFGNSFQLSLGVFKPSGETADATAYLDEIYLHERESRASYLNPSMSASWYNPDESGHGIMIHILDGTSAWMCWFAFDDGGDRAWICALGTIDGDTIEFADAFTVSGGAFPPAFDPDQITETPWGSITVTFDGCNSGTMTWVTSATGYQSGSMPIARLTPLWGADCS